MKHQILRLSITLLLIILFLKNGIIRYWPTDNVLLQGSYRVRSIKCNGVLPIGTYFNTINNPRNPIVATFAGTGMSLTYQLPNCKATFKFKIEDNTGRYFTSRPNGKVTCSNSEACFAYVNQLFGQACDTDNNTLSILYKYEIKEGEPNVLRLTNESQTPVCIPTHSGTDPLSLELLPL